MNRLRVDNGSPMQMCWACRESSSRSSSVLSLVHFLQGFVITTSVCRVSKTSVPLQELLKPLSKVSSICCASQPDVTFGRV